MFNTELRFFREISDIPFPLTASELRFVVERNRGARKVFVLVFVNALIANSPLVHPFGDAALHEAAIGEHLCHVAACGAHAAMA